MPRVPSSLLTHIQDEKISGINVPWMYMGMMFATFCWHNEDSHLNSVSYLHYGAPKTWYGIPGKYAQRFIKAMRSIMPRRFREEPDILDHLVTMVDPSWLINRGVPVCTATQTPGDFIVTFPSAYHAGFSHGYNCGEAVNFCYSRVAPVRPQMRRRVQLARPSTSCCVRQNGMHRRQIRRGEALQFAAGASKQNFRTSVRERAYEKAPIRPGRATKCVFP